MRGSPTPFRIPGIRNKRKPYAVSHPRFQESEEALCRFAFPDSGMRGSLLTFAFVESGMRASPSPFALPDSGMRGRPTPLALLDTGNVFVHGVFGNSKDPQLHTYLVDPTGRSSQSPLVSITVSDTQHIK